MSCTERHADLIAYLDDELEPSARAELESHLAGCAECQALLAAERRLTAGFAALSPVELPGDFEARFWARVARESEAPKPWWARVFTRRLSLAFGGAAAAALAAVLALRGVRTEVADETDWQIVSSRRDLALLEDPDLELVEVVDLLEEWERDPEREPG
jgi:anti-sigma factor RsiW